MVGIVSQSNDPYFNLASEEYLLKKFQADAFLLYRNAPAIVVGKHQNTLAEINFEYVRTNRITVARRISGGGTVYHDLGNLNFAFITDGEEGSLVDYRRYTLPIIGAMGQMGLEVTLGTRNELLLGRKKISGTASHVFKKRVMHHGTLLFSSALKELHAALKVVPSSFTDRAVKSVPSRVTNIRDHLISPMEMEEFSSRIFQYVLQYTPGARSYRYSHRDLEEIRRLRKEKYSTWAWNFGYSPRYQFTRELLFDQGRITLHLNVEKGVIRQLKFRGDFQGSDEIVLLEEHLTGVIHDPETLRSRLEGWSVAHFIGGLENEALLAALF